MLGDNRHHHRHHHFRGILSNSLRGFKNQEVSSLRFLKFQSQYQPILLLSVSSNVKFQWNPFVHLWPKIIQRDDDDDDWLVSLPPYPVNRGLTSAKAPLWPPERLIYLFTTTSMQCTTACALDIMHMIYAIQYTGYIVLFNAKFLMKS